MTRKIKSPNDSLSENRPDADLIVILLCDSVYFKLISVIMIICF